MQALILAAGQGRRLADVHGRPKCTRRIGGVPLVRHQLAALAAAGITDVVIVVGFAQDAVRDCAGSSASYVVNERFATTNSLCSFLIGQQLVDDDVVVLNADVFCHPALLALLADVDGDALLYDSGSGSDPEQMKVRVDAGCLVEMSKDLPAHQASGENVGILRLSRETAGLVAERGAAILATGGDDAWLAEGINQVAARRPFECLDVVGWPWVEVDFPEDLRRARGEVLAAMAGTEPISAAAVGPEPQLRRIS